MSVPHTGKLKAIVNGRDCEFNGDRWTSTDGELVELLNAATDTAPKHHYDIRDVALHVFRKLGINATIVSWVGDVWPSDLPGGVD